jgi:biopolymer transport protein TolR
MAFGRFERKSPPRPMGDINVTPLVDVMLVLVVIFILAAPLLASSIRLQLPQGGETGAPQDSAPAVTVALDRDGKLFLNDHPIEPGPLAERFAQAAQSRPDTEVRLRADREVPYGKVVGVMDAARKAGLGRIGFVTDPIDPAGTPAAGAPVFGPAGSSGR